MKGTRPPARRTVPAKVVNEQVAAAKGAAAPTSYWLVKSEPNVFSWDDLMNAPDRTTMWEGVRNYQARNYLRDGMKVGQRVLFYHSSAVPTAAMGICEIVRAAYPDPLQFDAKSDYYDAGSTRAEPRWVVVDLRAVEAFPTPVTLEAMKATRGLEGLELLRKGSRLSVQPVGAAHFAIIRKLGGLA
jgi:predicted RNA-binding protein with PUA-like domain